jgi:hypothetical protein
MKKSTGKVRISRINDDSNGVFKRKGCATQQNSNKIKEEMK